MPFIIRTFEVWIDKCDDNMHNFKHAWAVQLNLNDLKRYYIWEKQNMIKDKKYILGHIIRNSFWGELIPCKRKTLGVGRVLLVCGNIK